MFGFFESPQNSIDKGREALMYFHNHAMLYPQNYKLEFDELIQTLAKTDELRSAWLKNIGEAISSLSISDSEVKSAMEKMADEGQGRLPGVQTEWANALIDKSHEFSFIRKTSQVGDAIVEGSKEFVTDVADIGGSVITSAKLLGNIAPFVLAGAVIFIILMRTKRIAGN